MSGIRWIILCVNGWPLYIVLFKVLRGHQLVFLVDNNIIIGIHALTYTTNHTTCVLCPNPAKL